MSHANAALTPIQRLRIGQLIVEQHVPIAQAADLFMVSWPTAKRWADRYAAQLAAAPSEPVRASDLQDRSSRPLVSPRRAPQPLVRKIVHLRWRKRLGPVAIALPTPRFTTTSATRPRSRSSSAPPPGSPPAA